METPKQTLFCPGIPGAGKTIMASIIIEHLQQTFRNKKTGILYIYCTYNERHKAKDLVAYLVKQLTEQLPSLPEEVRKLYNLHEKTKSFPQRDDLIQILSSLARHFSRAFVIIDAIDECHDEDSRIEFLESIKKIKSFMNTLVTSRHIASIADIFERDSQQEIRATTEDITTYVESEISREKFVLSSDLSSKSELQSSVVKEIVSKAEGMYVLIQQEILKDIAYTPLLYTGSYMPNST
jgi:ribosomal protein S25